MSAKVQGIYWFTGLSGSGKTTLSTAVAASLRELGHPCLVLDGDQLRQGLCSDLGYEPQDRRENVRRAGEIALLAAAQGVVCLCAFITPYAALRETLRTRLSPHYREVFVDCPIEECIRRDPKALYRRARKGEVANLTGIGAPYEPPSSPELRICTASMDVASSTQAVVEYICGAGRR
jgi:adenylyl-sulfate kinase